MRQSVGLENRDSILKDIESLSLEKYVDEIVGAVAEGILKCKTEKDIWNAVEVRTRFPRKPSSHALSAYMRLQPDNICVAPSVPQDLHSRNRLLPYRSTCATVEGYACRTGTRTT